MFRSDSPRVQRCLADLTVRFTGFIAYRAAVQDADNRTQFERGPALARTAHADLLYAFAVCAFCLPTSTATGCHRIIVVRWFATPTPTNYGVPCLLMPALFYLPDCDCGYNARLTFDSVYHNVCSYALRTLALTVPGRTVTTKQHWCSGLPADCCGLRRSS